MADDSAILENDILTILMCDTLIFLDLDSISIIKKVLITDFGTCFAIYPFDDGYVIHGELEIIKTDKIGNVEWTFSGADIFATIDNSKAFSILDKTIILHDFLGNIYKLNQYGEQV